MSNVIEVTDATEVDDILSDEKNVVVDFFATWCGPCKMIAPILDKASVEHEGVKIVKVDIEVAEDLARRYNVRAVPTILFFSEGDVVDTHIGAISTAQLNSKIETLY